MGSMWASRRSRWARNGRGLSSVTSAIAIVVVLALVGIGTYGLLGGFSSGNAPVTCWPPTAFACGQFINLHDVAILLPFRSVQQGAQVPFTVSLPPSESATKYVLNFGDGNSSTSASPTLSHTFASPGVYLIEGQATVNGAVHDNLLALTLITVTPSFTAASVGNLPGLQGTLLSNTTSAPGARTVTAVLQPFESITVNGTYTSAPTNPGFLPNPPTFQVSGGNISNEVLTSSSGQAQVTFGNPGTYTVSFIGSASSGNLTLFQNFTWTAFVAPTGVHAGVSGSLVVNTPHPGLINTYELAPGGGFSEDPAIDYETVGFEPILNVYQTLINYNGSITGPTYSSFVPQLATCVPGSPQCERIYGAGVTLQDGWNYTFVIQANTSFYDPQTHAHWGVWPTDVVFSMARTLGFSTLPSISANNGWIIAQSLLNGGNATWDSIHGGYNNTPQNIMSSMLINDSNFCPAAALTDPSTSHGCVTFVAHGAHHEWPYFLELIADPLGGSIVPCGWFSASAQGAGIPYWTQGNSSGAGDRPCPAMGSPGWGQAVGTVPATGWDQWEQLGSGAFGTYQGHVQYNMLGSGPYYMQEYSVAIGYALQANPNYGQNPYCTWSGCMPAAGNYAPSVTVLWETSATPGEQAYAAGIADFASIPQPDLQLLIQLINEGKVNAISAPSLTIGFFPFDMNFNIAGAQKFTTNPISVPTDWFSYMGMRQFFARAYPYTTVQNTIHTYDGIQLSFDYGGAIPQFMADYYPRDIPWPSTDPCTATDNPVCPSYWWDQMHQSSSIYYDPQVLPCSSADPCALPMFGTTASAANDQVMALWSSQVSQLTGGAVKVTPIDINFVDLIVNSEFSGPGQNPMPIYRLGWAPDYPDPTDYVAPLYAANGTYGYGDSLMQSLLVHPYTDACPSHDVRDYNYFANTTFGNVCQGVAYKAMLHAIDLAAVAPAGPYRVMLYNLAEKIAYQLALYVYTGQGNIVASGAAWIDTTSINTNVTIGGGGDTPFFWLTGNGVQYQGST